MSTTTARSDASKSVATTPNASELLEDGDDIEVISQLDASTTGERPRVPSRDIRDDLHRIFASDKFEYNGSFYASHSQLSPPAPNPGLCAGYLGLMGLPLVEGTAKQLIAGCKQAAFGKGERTIVDTNVRDTWEMDGSKVTFANPAWNTWVDTVALPSICKSLGVNMKSSKPKAELYKLLVYEKGSHFLQHQDTAKVPGMFATMVILLPSQFTGGTIDLSHSGKRATIDAAPDSAFSTHVAAWYTDVFHAIRPVHSGYRLALSYNIIHTTTPSLKPALEIVNARYLELERTFNSWNLQEEPWKLFYLMDHMYSANDLRGASLKGKDAHIVSHLRGMSDQLGFHMCLVNLELHEQGQAERDDGDYLSSHNWEMGEVNERTLSISHAFDLDGNSLDFQDLDLDEETEFFPGALGDDKPDKSEYEGYQGNYAGDMNHWYRSSALLMWPEMHDGDMGGTSVEEYAEERLNQSGSEEATESEQKAVERLIAWSNSESGHENHSVIQAVRSAAIRWGNVDIWLRICSAGGVAGNLDLLGPEAITEDVDLFGFTPLKKFLTSAIKHNRTDEARFQLLAELELLADETSDNALLKWVKEQEERVLRSLRVANADGIPRYLLATRERGYVYLRDVIIPQLVFLKPPSIFWLAIRNAFREAKDQNSQETKEKEEAILILASQEISTRDPFPVKAVSTPGPEDRRADLEAWIGNIKDATALGDTVLKAYLESMVASWENINAAEKQWMSQNFLPGAMDRLSDTVACLVPPRLPGDESLASFWLLALTYYLENYPGNELKLLTALHWYGDYESLKGILDPILRRLATSSSGSLQELVTRYYESPALLQIDKVTAPSLVQLVDSSALILATYTPLGERTAHGYGLHVGSQPDCEFTLDLVRTFLRHSSQGPVLELSPEDLGRLAELDEPSRFVKWLQQMFEVAPNAEITQRKLVELYARDFSRYGRAKMLSAVELIKMVSTVFSHAVPVERGNAFKFVIRAIRRRRANADFEITRQEGDSSIETPPQSKLFEVILKRLSGFSMTADYLNKCLLPLVSGCIAEFHRLDIDWPSQPLSGFASDSIHKIVTMLGPKPLAALTDAELKRLGCGCANCLNLRQFVASDRKTLSIRALKKERTHIEAMLSSSPAHRWDIKWETISSGSPHVLQITKPAIIGAHKSWAEATKPVLDAISSLGPPSTQAAVLGDRYIEICSTLHIQVPAVATITHPPRAGPSSAPPRPTENRPLVGEETSLDPTPSTTASSAKRSYHDALGSHTSAPVSKRSKPKEIIELSD